LRIIVAYDGSECSDEAIDDLQRAGFPKQVEALVMTVADVFVPPPLNEEIDNTFPFQIPAGVRHAHERAKRELEQARALARQASKRLQDRFPEWNVQYEAVANSPAWAVVAKADEWQPDLIVVGAHGRSLLAGRLILGSVSQRILYEARCSVRVARTRPKKVEESLRILVGVDGSTYSNRAIEAVAERHWPKGTQVRLLTVVDTVMAVNSNSSEETPVLKWIDVEQEENWEQVRQLFQPAVEKLKSAGLDAAVMIRRGSPWTEVIDEAESWNADSVFLGPKGIRGAQRLLLGSVSSAVAARAHCSVEIVRRS